MHFGLYPSQNSWILKFQALWTWCGRDLHLSSGRGSHCAVTDTGLTQKGSHSRAQEHRYGAKHTKRSVSRLAALIRCPCTDAEGWGREMSSTGYFVPCESMIPLSDVFQEGGVVSTTASQEILRSCHLLPGYLPAFSTGAWQCLQGSISVMPWTPKTLVFESCWYKRHKNQPLLFSQSMALGLQVFSLWDLHAPFSHTPRSMIWASSSL